MTFFQHCICARKLLLSVFQVEGILQNTQGGIDVDSIEDFEAPTLNSFEKSQPLDDLLIRRRSLHSSPANSRYVTSKIRKIVIQPLDSPKCCFITFFIILYFLGESRLLYNVLVRWAAFFKSNCFFLVSFIWLHWPGRDTVAEIIIFWNSFSTGIWPVATWLVLPDKWH